MSETKHTPTPTPWARDQYGSVRGSDGEKIILSNFGLSCGPRNPQAEADDAFVFRAVNSHDALVDALESSRAMLRRLHDEYYWGTGTLRLSINSQVTEISAALKFAEGQP